MTLLVVNLLASNINDELSFKYYLENLSKVTRVSSNKVRLVTSLLPSVTPNVQCLLPTVYIKC